MKQNKHIKRLLFELYELCVDNVTTSKMEKFVNALADTADRYGYSLNDIHQEMCEEEWQKTQRNNSAVKRLQMKKIIFTKKNLSSGEILIPSDKKHMDVKVTNGWVIINLNREGKDRSTITLFAESYLRKLDLFTYINLEFLSEKGSIEYVLY